MPEGQTSPHLGLYPGLNVPLHRRQGFGVAFHTLIRITCLIWGELLYSFHGSCTILYFYSAQRSQFLYKVIPHFLLSQCHHILVPIFFYASLLIVKTLFYTFLFTFEQFFKTNIHSLSAYFSCWKFFF